MISSVSFYVFLYPVRFYRGSPLRASSCSAQAVLLFLWMPPEQPVPASSAPSAALSTHPAAPPQCSRVETVGLLLEKAPRVLSPSHISLLPSSSSRSRLPRGQSLDVMEGPGEVSTTAPCELLRQEGVFPRLVEDGDLQDTDK